MLKAVNAKRNICLPQNEEVNYSFRNFTIRISVPPISDRISAEFRNHLFEKRREEFPKIKMFNLKKKPSKLLNFKYNK